MRPLFKPNLRPNLGPTPINSLGPSRPATKLSGQAGQPSINRRPSTTMAQQRASPPSISSLTRGPPCSRWSPSSREAYANAQHVMAIIKPYSCTNSSCLRPYPAHQSFRQTTFQPLCIHVFFLFSTCMPKTTSCPFSHACPLAMSLHTAKTTPYTIPWPPYRQQTRLTCIAVVHRGVHISAKTELID